MDIEKGDVDISQLFRWNTEVSITDRKGEELAKVYIRLLGDKDINQARVFSLRESAELRKKLRDTKSDEHIAFISEIPSKGKDNIIAGVKLLRLGELAQAARKNVIVKFPQEPASDASLEEQEEYQKAVDDFPDTYGDMVEVELEILAKAEEKRLRKLKVVELREEYTDMLTEYVCRQEMERKFLDRTVFLATYSDEDYKKKAFETFAKYDDSAPEVKDQLKTAYNDLELGVTEVKKLQEATQ